MSKRNSASPNLCTKRVGLEAGCSQAKKQLPAATPTNEDGRKDVLTNAPGQVGSGGAGDSAVAPGSTINGDQKDEAATSPTDNLSKIAKSAATQVESLRALGLLPGAPKAASEKGIAPAKAADAQSGQGDPVTDVKDLTESGKPKVPAAPATTGLPAAEPKNTDKKATEIFPVNTPEAIQKLASAAQAIFQVEGGMKLAEDLLRKSAGVEQAKTLLDDLTLAYAGAAKYASEIHEDLQAKEAAIAEAHGLYQELTKGASAKDLDTMTKIANAIFPAVDALQHPLEKMAMMQGAEDAATMEDAGAMSDDPAVAGAAELPGAEGAPSMQQVAQLIASMVQTKEISEDKAVQVLEILTQPEAGAEGGDPAAGGAPAPEGALPPEAGAGAPPEGAMPPEGALPPEEAPAPETEEMKAATALLSSIK